jgi:hypothetical protein
MPILMKNPKISATIRYIDLVHCPDCNLFEQYCLNSRTDKTDRRVNRKKCTRNCSVFLCGSNRCPQMYLIDNTWNKINNVKN